MTRKASSGTAAATERSPPGLHRSSSPPPIGPLLADPLELGGRPVPRRREMMLAYGRHPAATGAPPSRSPAILVAATDWTIAGRSPGGRPVPRRREMMLAYGRHAAATERSPPGLQRSSLPPPVGPLLTDPLELEGARSLGAGK